MNTTFKLIFLTSLLVQFGAAASIPLEKFFNKRGTASHRTTFIEKMFSNFIDDYEPESQLQNAGKDLISRTCEYYDYKDTCHNSNDGCSKETETCERNDGCYAVWRGNEKLLQGCWSPSSRLECTPGHCAAESGLFSSKAAHDDRTYFCCCFGDNCNEQYGLSNHIPNWP